MLLTSLIDQTVDLQKLYPIPREIPMPSLVGGSRHGRESGPQVQDPDGVRRKAVAYEGWRVRIVNALETIFGLESPQLREWSRLVESRTSSRDHELVSVEGLLRGALADLDGGYLTRSEVVIAGEVLDSILARAEKLLNEGHIDCAAVLCRVAVEDALRRLAQREGVDDTLKAAQLNEALWRERKLYTKGMWRQVQSALDTGNSAAHGKTDEYTQADVKSSVQVASTFLAAMFHV